MGDNQKQGGFISQTVAWFAHPLQTNGSALNWWLFVGLIVIAIWMWGRILARITEI